jgi:UPF0716 family protein affecting phage T7 exclusion
MTNIIRIARQIELGDIIGALALVGLFFAVAFWGIVL